MYNFIRELIKNKSLENKEVEIILKSGNKITASKLELITGYLIISYSDEYGKHYISSSEIEVFSIKA